jgi:hypothetical protein
MNIVGKLKVDITINGKKFKAGETVSIPEQYGLEQYLESPKADNHEDKGGKK